MNKPEEYEDIVQTILLTLDSISVYVPTDECQDWYLNTFDIASRPIYTFESIFDINMCRNSIIEIVKIISSIKNVSFYNNDMSHDNVCPKDTYKNALILLGDNMMALMDNYSIRSNSDIDITTRIFLFAIRFYETVLIFDDFNYQVRERLTNYYTKLSNYKNKLGDSVGEKICLDKAMSFYPTNPFVYHKLGVWYINNGDSTLALVNFELAISLANSLDINIDNDAKIHLIIVSYSKIADIFNGKKQYLNATNILHKALLVDAENPDICNILGLTYSYQHKYEIAIDYFHIGLRRYQHAKDSEGMIHFKSKTYSNIGLMYYMIGNNDDAIKYYTLSHETFPITVTFQNHLLSSINGFNQQKNKLDIKILHRQINSKFEYLRKLKPDKYLPTQYCSGSRINIGIVSSDFDNHVVFAFISSYLLNFTYSDFSVTCYINFDTSNPVLENRNNIIYKNIDTKTAIEAADEIYNDKIHILLDLNGHTSGNRLNIFSLKPAPIQITYLGYAFSTGLDEMDYRITDSICDNDIISQTLNSEKLLFMKDCFICFNPNIFSKNTDGGYVKILPTPYLKNQDFIKIGCFSRPDKLTLETIDFFNSILMENDRVQFVCKFRGIDSGNNRCIFLEKFDIAVRDRILLLKYTDTYLEHLDKYNDIDISIDTFPYSGTTTCCDSLYMGVPMFTLYDSTFYFHAHNVSSSITTNTHSDMRYFILNEKTSIHNKIRDLQNRSHIFWQNLKEGTRKKFLSGKVCDTDNYIKNIENIFRDVIKTRFEM